MIASRADEAWSVPSSHFINVLLGMITSLAVLGTAGCVSRVGDSQSTVPALLINPKVLDFGTTKESIVEQQLSVTNRAKFVVRIVDFDRSCGCTAPTLTLPCEIPPGSAIKFPVKLRSSPEQRGTVSQRLGLRTDDPSFPNYVVPIIGVVGGERRVTVLPEVLSFGKIGDWEDAVREFEVYHADSMEFHIKPIIASDSEIRVIPRGRANDGGFLYQVVLGKMPKVGRVDEIVDIETSHGHASVRIICERMGSVFVEPSTLVCEHKETVCLKKLVLIHSPKMTVEGISMCCDIADGEITDVSLMSPGKTLVKLALKFVKKDLPTRGSLRIRTGLSVEPLAVNVLVNNQGDGSVQ